MHFELEAKAKAVCFIDIQVYGCSLEYTREKNVTCDVSRTRYNDIINKSFDENLTVNCYTIILRYLMETSVEAKAVDGYGKKMIH